MPLACNLSSLQIDAAHEYVDRETYPFTRKSQAKIGTLGFLFLLLAEREADALLSYPVVSNLKYAFYIS